jgi:hypothetical protein
MQLFSGLPTTDYQDVLRALGRFLDERGYRNVRIIENEEGLLVQGMPVINGKASGTFETFLMTDDAVKKLLVTAYERRTSTPRQPMPPVPETPPVSALRRLRDIPSVAEPRPTGLTGLLPSQRLSARSSD